MSLPDLVLKIALDAFWSGIAAVGFAVLFNVPRSLLAGCLLTGALGHAVRALLMDYGMSIEWGTLISATLVGFCAKWLATRTNSPSAIFAIAGGIPMVPGVFAYRTMISLLSLATATTSDVSTALMVEASTNAIKTALILAAIGIGIAAPTLLFQRPKPVA